MSLPRHFYLMAQTELTSSRDNHSSILAFLLPQTWSLLQIRGCLLHLIPNFQQVQQLQWDSPVPSIRHSPEHPVTELCSSAQWMCAQGAPEFHTHLDWPLAFSQEWWPSLHGAEGIYQHSLWAYTSSTQQTSSAATQEHPVKSSHKNPGRNTSPGCRCWKIHLLAFAKGRVRLCWLRSLCPGHWVRSGSKSGSTSPIPADKITSALRESRFESSEGRICC